MAKETSPFPPIKTYKLSLDSVKPLKILILLKDFQTAIIEACKNAHLGLHCSGEFADAKTAFISSMEKSGTLGQLAIAVTACSQCPLHTDGQCTGIRGENQKLWRSGYDGAVLTVTGDPGELAGKSTCGLTTEQIMDAPHI